MRQDLVLITCAEKRYVVKQSELEQCHCEKSTFLCPADVLAAVSDTFWLKLKWTPGSQISFNHAHILLPNCNNLLPLICLGGRYYLAAAQTNLSITTSNKTSNMFLYTLWRFITFLVNFPFTYNVLG